jgi:uncharacterized integral membrane protein
MAASPEVSEPGASAPEPGLDSSSASGGTRIARHARNARLYASTVVVVVLLVALIVLGAANTHAAKLDWVVGSTHASLVWIMLAAALVGWLLGVATAVVVRRRAR